MKAWNRPLAIAAGLGILALGIRVGASSGVCDPVHITTPASRQESLSFREAR
jgi:hypothetical protein